MSKETILMVHTNYDKGYCVREYRGDVELFQSNNKQECISYAKKKATKIYILGDNGMVEGIITQSQKDNN